MHVRPGSLSLNHLKVVCRLNTACYLAAKGATLNWRPTLWKRYLMRVLLLNRWHMSAKPELLDFSQTCGLYSYRMCTTIGKPGNITYLFHENDVRVRHALGMRGGGEPSNCVHNHSNQKSMPLCTDMVCTQLNHVGRYHKLPAISRCVLHDLHGQR